MSTSGSTPTTEADGALHVVAAAIVSEGHVLLARRSADRHQGGLWEFPGGKREPGEAPAAALFRELDEELGIRPLRMRRLITVEHAYPEVSVFLDVWRVDAFAGRPSGREGQPLAWVPCAELGSRPLPAANRPIVQALQLPDRCLITPEDLSPTGLRSRLRRLDATDLALIQLRHPYEESRVAEWASEMRQAGERLRGIRWVINGAPEQAVALGAHGVHLSSRRLRALDVRPLGREYWVGASCHDADELARAAAMGLDYAVLSPVQTTPHRPGVPPLGWEQFQALVSGVPLPVFALGGVGPCDLETAWWHGAQGVAGIRGMWPDSAD